MRAVIRRGGFEGVSEDIVLVLRSLLRDAGKKIFQSGTEERTAHGVIRNRDDSRLLRTNLTNSLSAQPETMSRS